MTALAETCRPRTARAKGFGEGPALRQAAAPRRRKILLGEGKAEGDKGRRTRSRMRETTSTNCALTGSVTEPLAPAARQSCGGEARRSWHNGRAAWGRSEPPRPAARGGSETTTLVRKGRGALAPKERGTARAEPSREQTSALPSAVVAGWSRPRPVASVATHRSRQVRPVADEHGALKVVPRQSFEGGDSGIERIPSRTADRRSVYSPRAPRPRRKYTLY